MELDYITFAVIIFCALWVGWTVRGAILLIKFGANPEFYIDILQRIKKINEQEAREEQTETDGTELAIERHGEVLYAFVKETNQFIAQGTDLNMLLEEAKKRFPNRRFFGVIDKDNPAKELA